MPSVFITGANRGLGLEFSAQYCALGWEVIACARDLTSADELIDLNERFPNLSLFELDISSPTHLAAVKQGLAKKPIDLLINNAGVYGPAGVSLETLDSRVWANVFEINTIAPMMVAQTLMENVLHSEHKKIVFLSSKMGSIEDNTSGGSYVYRSSKCALNAAAKSLALDAEPKGVCVLILHPGWVQTDMGGPNALIGPKESVEGMRNVISEKTHRDTGGFFSYDGKHIPW